MKSKKRVIKIIQCIFVICIITWLGIFITDYIRCGSLKEPVFVVASNNIQDDGGSGTYYGLGYVIKMQKQISAEYGVRLLAVEMRMFNKVISASVQ